MNRFLVSYLQYLMKVLCKYALVYMEAVLHCMMLVALVVVALVSKNMLFRQHFPFVKEQLLKEFHFKQKEHLMKTYLMYASSCKH